MPTEFQRNFDRQAEGYDLARPEYPPELYSDIFAYCPIDESSRVLEIGLGTGKASGPVLETGCSLTGLEPGGNLGDLAKKRLGGYENLDHKFQGLGAKIEKVASEKEIQKFRLKVG